MGLQRQGWLRWTTLLALAVSVNCVRRSELFPHGEGAGDRALPPGNDHTQELPLDKPVLFYDGKFDKVYINTNGFVATGQPAPESEYLGNMPASFGMIAALVGDLDTSDGLGQVYYRQDSSPAVLRKAAEHINRAFPEDDEVEPSHSLVVTWAGVAPHDPQNGGNQQRNTFQLVIASGETTSYAILLYPSEAMQFHATPLVGRSEPMQAGFGKGLVKFLIWSTRQGPYYRITTEEEDSVRKLSEQTNSGKPGVWVYEIGTAPYFTAIAPGEVTELPKEVPAVRRGDKVLLRGTGRPVQDALHNAPVHPVHPVQFQPQNPEIVVVDDSDINVDVFSYNFETCANNRQKCSTFADCRDYPNGYCCHCRPGFYGNGKQCVAEGKPQRMNGKVSGRVFVGTSPSPVELSGNDLHSYVVANDGRAYVAISTIPPRLGPSLLPLSSLGGVIGWAFALQQPGHKNGFSIIGGEFTRQAEVTFLPGNEKLSIKQEFKGIDEHDHLLVNTDLEGTVPEVPPGTTVEIDPYSEIYHYSSSLITSSATRDYVLTLPGGTRETRTFQWRQTIVFQSCPHDESGRNAVPTQQLSVDQVFVMYDSGNQLIRYAMSNKIGSIHGGEPEENPCFTGRHGCDTNAICRPGQGSQFTCECGTGFTGDGRRCYDVDECRENPQVCGPNALCSNQPGTFRCECADGYQFALDGRTCEEADRPSDHCQEGTHNCDVPERAQCSFTGGSSYVCSCLPGFLGDGRRCQDIDECQQQGRCHRDAVCYNTQGSFTCQCRPGFHGDGFQCSSGHEKTQCEHHRDTVLASSGVGPRGPRPLPGQYVPTCDARGAYEPVQCHASTGQCWCVGRNGGEIPGTRTGPGSTPMCIDPDVPPVPVGPTPRPDVQPLPPGTHLLFAQSGKIEHVPLEGYDVKKDQAKAVLHLPEKVVIGVAYDCVEKMVYWTDITTPAISRASVQGGEPTPIITADLESPEGIAVDHLGRTLFWTDSMRDRIEVASLDGTKRRVLFDTDLVNPRAIIADPVHGYLYWADWNRQAPKIEASYMDGTNRKVLVKDDLGLPNALTYDPQSSLLCWADAGTHKVECMNPTRSDRRTVLEGIQYPFSMVSFGKNLYYTDWKRDAVVVVDRATGKESDQFQPQKRSRLYGIATAYAQCPTGRNYCAVNNGGCTHLCLATPSGRSCLCPDNAIGVSCVEREGRY
ncbi:hypothetical protein ANANG_G00306150 [Anguilla anguilla]|uniref:Nidogen-1 n=1 Tax=Anguilla anguilla TaxID=7936 RepID=A0A9D3LIU9_ANGAN|nr:hypothetical protein ANANG_G00306150 [Anguilla anguilla]